MATDAEVSPGVAAPRRPASGPVPHQPVPSPGRPVPSRERTGTAPTKTGPCRSFTAPRSPRLSLPFWRSWRDMSPWWKLVALCVGANLAETALVMGFDHGASPELAPQASAIAPFGVFGDLRWISVYHESWPGLVVEVAAMLFVRGALTAYSVFLAWPAHVPSPSGRRLLSRGVFATALAAVLLAPSVVLLFSLATVPVSWLFLAAVPSALLVAFIAHPVGVSNDWWRRLFAPRALGWVLLAFLTLSLASAAMAVAPPVLWPVISGLTGLFNAWSWVGLVHVVVDRRPARYVVPAVPLATVALVGVVIGGTVLGFAHVRDVKADASPLGVAGASTGPPAGTGQPVLIVSGYGSSWDGRDRHPVPGNFLEEPFSYRGLSATAAPLPYTEMDTVRAVPKLDSMFLAQVWALYQRTGQRVDVVAESEGALVAKTALLAEPGSPVAMLVMASPLEDPGRVSYPTSGDKGWGVASDEGMRLLSEAFQRISPVDLSPNSPFLASILSEAPVLEKAVTCPISGIRQFALLPLADATVVPAAEKLSFPSVVLPAFHGGLIDNPSGEKVLSKVLSNRPVSEDQVLQLADEAISYAASGWQVPSLARSDYPAVERANGSETCPQVASLLRLALAAG